MDTLISEAIKASLNSVRLTDDKGQSQSWGHGGVSVELWDTWAFRNNTSVMM